MFLKELVEDYDFEDVKFVFENDKYFLYSSERYKLTEEDEINFSKLKSSSETFKMYSLEVVSLRKSGFLSRIELIDHEDEIRGIKDVELSELASYPVDLTYSRNNRKAIQLIISLLLERTFYSHLENKQSLKSEKSLGAIEIEKAVIED